MFIAATHPLVVPYELVALELVQGVTIPAPWQEGEDYVFTREDGEDGSRVVAPRKEWYSLCVSSGLGKYELEERKNGESYKKYAGLNLAWLQAFGTSEHDQAGSYREGGYEHLGALHTVSFRPLQHRGRDGSGGSNQED